MIRLLSHEKCPPGEFWYLQTTGLRHKFGHSPILSSLAIRVAKFRQANNLPRADEASALEDIDAFTCARLNNNPAWCYDSDKPIAALAPKKKGCVTCGHH